MRALAIACLLLVTGCDVVREAAPEGWESVEDGASARRLYYQFIDTACQVRFVERIEEVPEALRAGVGFVKLDVAPPGSPADARRVRATRTVTLAPAAAGPRIIVYYADWCGACRKAKRYLNDKGVAFEIRNVDDPAVAAELRSKTGARSIPVIDVDGRILTGFSPSALDALIDRA
jgi:glutaredoxin 3